MYSEKLIIRRKQIEEEISRISKELEKMPAGELHCERNGKYVKWFNYHDGIAEYIPKKEKEFAEELAVRRYKEMQMEELQTELKAINAFLKCRNRKSGQASHLLDEKSCYMSLLTPYFSVQEEFLERWMNEPYERNTAHLENLIHKSVAGIMVRSKSEALIVSALYRNHIPFRYECPLQLGVLTIYPDFTILHPKTKKIYYWEHFGQMDNQDYIRKTSKKLQTYFENGINPANKLIMTFESSTNPLDYEVVDETIRLYFI